MGVVGAAAHITQRACRAIRMIGCLHVAAPCYGASYLEHADDEDAASSHDGRSVAYVTKLSPLGPTGPMRSLRFAAGASTCAHLLAVLRSGFYMPDAPTPYRLYVVVNEHTGALREIDPSTTLMTTLMSAGDAVTLLAEARLADGRVSMHTFLVCTH